MLLVVEVVGTTLLLLAARAGGEQVLLVSDGPVMLDAPISFTGRYSHVPYCTTGRDPLS
jgi:hypothetical protein